MVVVELRLPKHLTMVVVGRRLAYPRLVVEEDLMMQASPKGLPLVAALVAGPHPKDSLLVAGPIHL